MVATEKKPKQVGDMWYAPYLTGEANPFRNTLSQVYWRDHSPNRPPIVVRLPGPVDFCLDSLAWKIVDGRSRYYGDGWNVAGVPPMLTISPSINIVGTYHGFLKDGIILDDVEGRRFSFTDGTEQTSK